MNAVQLEFLLNNLAGGRGCTVLRLEARVERLHAELCSLVAHWAARTWCYDGFGEVVDLASEALGGETWRTQVMLRTASSIRREVRDDDRFFAHQTKAAREMARLFDLLAVAVQALLFEEARLLDRRAA
jgi:hypothetical protein